jgi:flagellar protein FlaG
MVDSLQLQNGVSLSRQESKVSRESAREFARNAVSAPSEQPREVANRQAAGEVAPATGNTAPAPQDQRNAEDAGIAAALDEALSTLSEHVQNLQRTLQFSVDKESGQTIIKVMDSETKEVIRQIPAEEMLIIARRLQAASGVFLVERA